MEMALPSPPLPPSLAASSCHRHLSCFLADPPLLSYPVILSLPLPPLHVVAALEERGRILQQSLGNSCPHARSLIVTDAEHRRGRGACSRVP
jgi:hypothetical protein